MHDFLVDVLRCPVTRSKLRLEKITTVKKQYDNNEIEVIDEGILFADEHWFYPIVKGIPRLNVEAIFDYAEFLQKYVSDYQVRVTKLNATYLPFIKTVQKRTKKTKESFSKEWSIYDYETDKTWGADSAEMLNTFLAETDETIESLRNKFIFDAGCGNGALQSILAGHGIRSIAMDFSNSIERAYEKNKSSHVNYIQGNLQFPPVKFNHFDIVHSSGVLIATNNTELSFSCIEPLVKENGKLSVWLYHHRNDFIHNMFNGIRQITSKLPLSIQYYLYLATLFPISFIIKRLKGNKQNTREMMVDILDWFSPEFRWEHDHEEARTWFLKRNYTNTKVTTDTMFGFSIIGEKKASQ
jgi:2-polyprenyl-3-methyl-5-hydroxy-6-metoxy-1,4-benzoquinol methylase/uncharacterized protein YbaR (Trm112 family)